MTVAWDARDFPIAETESQRRWWRHDVILAGTVAVLLLLFAGDVADLAGIYWNSTTYGHCLFVLPVFAWLVWQRRAGLARLTPEGWWPGLAVVGGGATVWLAGFAGEVALLRHLGLVTMLQGSVLAALGPNVARGLVFPLAWLFFLVPFGEELEAPLQDFTAAMAIGLLGLAGVPASIDGVLITTPNGYFEVAEACSGAKFVIAMIAYATLVANVCFVSWRRRVAFFAMAMVVPILANGLRAFGTIYAAWLTSVEEATGLDHIIYGWVFFAAVMAGVLAIGWRWFDRDPDAAWFDPATLQGPVRGRIDGLLAGVLTLLTGALALGWANVIDARADPMPQRIALPEIAFWQQEMQPAAARWAPHYPGADHRVMMRYTDRMGGTVDLSVALFANQRDGKEMIGFGIGPLRENDLWVRVEDLPPLAGGAAIRMRAPGPVERETVTFYAVGNVVTGSARRAKLETMRVRLLGGPQRAVAITLSAPREGQDSRATLERFVRALGPLDRFAGRVAAGAR